MDKIASENVRCVENLLKYFRRQFKLATPPPNTTELRMDNTSQLHKKDIY